jgi:UDP-glucuronate 4-epimerase
MVRDFTFVDDVVEGILRVADKPATPNALFDADHPDPATSQAPYRIFNVGNNRPTPLMDYIDALERALGRKAIKNYLPMQPGDVPVTSACTDELDTWVGFKPDTPITDGVARFVDWYQAFYAPSIQP